MSRLKPMAHDSELAAREVDRRAALAQNETYQRGISEAKKTNLDNLRIQLNNAFGDLQRMARVPGSVAAARAGYLRSYANIERLAGVIASETGESIEVPDFDPPEVLSMKTRTIGPAPKTGEVVTRPDGTKATIIPSECYVERGPKNGVHAVPILGTATDDGWLTRGLAKVLGK